MRMLLKAGDKDSLAQAVRLFENKDLARVISSEGPSEPGDDFITVRRSGY